MQAAYHRIANELGQFTHLYIRGLSFAPLYDGFKPSFFLQKKAGIIPLDKITSVVISFKFLDYFKDFVS